MSSILDTYIIGIKAKNGAYSVYRLPKEEWNDSYTACYGKDKMILRLSQVNALWLYYKELTT